MASFDVAVEFLLKNEGSALVQNDNGRGPSKYGITLKTAREIFPHWTEDNIARLDPLGAKKFYHAWAWVKYGIGRIEAQAVATKILDLAANIGPPTAIKILQKAVAVKDDGVLGRITTNAVNLQEPHKLMPLIRRAATIHYAQLVVENRNLADSLYGWLTRLRK